MRNNLLSLQQTAKLQDLTQNRLATGLKVNSAIDNPSSYYTAQSLNNRAEDLNVLLDAMSQGIQTLKATIQTIEAATGYLEQASSFTRQTMDGQSTVTASKEWFERQAGVGAVVSTKEELLAALDSASGKIVVYGSIDMGDTAITLNDGQSLVGVGSFAAISDRARDSQLDKFSSLNWNVNISQPTVVMGNDTSISDLSLKISTTIGGYNTFVGAWNKQGLEFKNIDLVVDGGPSSQNFYGINIVNSTAEFKGINNIRATGASNNVAAFSNNNSVINIGGNTILNVENEKGIGIRGNGNIFNFYDNAQINVRARLGVVQSDVLNLKDSASLNIESNDVGFLYGHLNILSANAQLKIFAGRAFCSNSNDVSSLVFNVVEGAVIKTQEGVYTAPAGGVNATVPIMYISDISQFGFIRDASQNSGDDPVFTEIFNKFMQDDSESFQLPEDAKTWDNKNTVDQFNLILSQYDQLVNDGWYKGVNLLKKQDLKVVFNEGRTSDLDIKGVNATVSGLGINKATIDTELAVTLEEIDSAINQLRLYASEFGNYYQIVTTRENFTNSLINVLTEGADQLTLADMNQESANMLALQTRQQLAVNSLSLASQASQSVLKLF